MAPRLFQAFFHIVTFCLVAGQSKKYGLKGQEVKFKPQIQGQRQPDQLLWMHNEDKVVEFNGIEEVAYRSFKNRITLDWHSAELHLTDLRSEDSGLYELEVHPRTSHLYRYNLQVIDKVAKPTITCETNTTDSSNISGLLTCSAAQPGVEYEWLFSGNAQPGPHLRIFLGHKLDERVYSCRVSNPLSNETAEFKAQDCYSGSSVLPVVLSIVLPLLFLLLVVVAAILIYRRYHKGERRSNVNGNTPSGALREGEVKAQDETPKKDYVRRLRQMWESGSVQQTPVKDHRNQVLENNKVALQNLSPRSQHDEKLPLLDQRRSVEAGEGADPASEPTSAMQKLSLNKPEPAETEPSVLKSSTKEPDADDNKEELQSSPCSPAHDEQPAPLDDSHPAGSKGHQNYHEGEGGAQDGRPKKGHVASTIQMYESGIVQKTPVKDHRNHRVALQNLSPHSQKDEKPPVLDQKSSDEDDEGADPASELMIEMQKLSLTTPEPAETEPSVLKSSIKEPVFHIGDSLVSDADNKEELQSSPCSLADDEQPASLDDSLSSDHDDGDQFRQSTPVSQSSEGPDPPEGENSGLDKDDNVQFNPPTASSPYPNSAHMASKDAAGEDREVSSSQLMEESDTSFKDAVESHINSTYFSINRSDSDSSQLVAEKGTRPTASSVETEQNKENSADGAEKDNI